LVFLVVVKIDKSTFDRQGENEVSADIFTHNPQLSNDGRPSEADPWAKERYFETWRVSPRG
jgi:hypothetical protein